MYSKKIIFIFLFFYSSLFAQNFKVSYDPDYAPLSYSIDAKAYGLLIDIWKLWAKESNNSVTFVKAKDWDDALNLAKNGSVDFFLGTTPYEKWMKVDKAYYQTCTAIFILKTNKIGIEKIGIVGDDYREVLKEKLKNVNIISFVDYKSLLDALITKKVDAIYDDSIAISYYAIENKYKHLIKEDNSFSDISKIYAISNSEKKVKYFTKYFNKISFSELKEIEKNWILDDSYKFFKIGSFKNIELSYVFDPDWKPFEYKDDMTNSHMGIISDILSLVSSDTGIKFKPITTDSWSDSTLKMKNDEADMFSAVPYTKERGSYLNFTKNSIYSYPAVLVSDKDKEYIIDEDLVDAKIGVVKHNSLGEFVKNRYKNSKFVEFKNVNDGFEALEDKEIDFFAINGVTATYYINVIGFEGAKINYRIDYMFHLKIALQKSIDKNILDAIDNSLSKLSKKDLNDIYHKWSSIKIKKEINFKIIFIILAIGFFVIMLFFYANKKLKLLIKMKTIELHELNETLEEKVKLRTKELLEIYKKVEDNIEYASIIQNSVLPTDEEFSECFYDFFTIWKPKDVVGGDIYLFHKISEEKYLLLMVDCTGHGVSGAFVTMLVKAIKEQLVIELKEKSFSTSDILNYFNRSLKNLLKQENINLNLGIDAGVIMIDKSKDLLVYSGANINLYYKNENNMNYLKADRESIGYKQSKDDYNYKEYRLSLSENKFFYISTDGFIDQNGGEKGFPLGRRNFINLLKQISILPIAKQEKQLLKELNIYKKDEEQNDDIALIGFSFSYNNLN